MSSFGGSQTYQDISGICLQRRRRQMLIPHGSRAELQKSPYPAYSQFQLDMRRKAEIFRYADPSTGLTAKKQYAGIVLNGGNRSYTQEVLQQIVSGKTVCPSSQALIPTPTSSCNVPGPPGILFLDPTVPLYNFTPVEQSGSFLAQENKRQYLTFATNDIAIKESELKIVWTLYIDNSIPSPRSTISFELPFLLTKLGSGPSIEPINVYVYSFYNSMVLSTNDTRGTYIGGQRPFLPDVPNYYCTLTTINATTSQCLLSVSNFVMPTNPGDIIDIAVVFLTNLEKDNVAILGNPTGGSGLVFHLT